MYDTVQQVKIMVGKDRYFFLIAGNLIQIKYIEIFLKDNSLSIEVVEFLFLLISRKLPPRFNFLLYSTNTTCTCTD